MGTAILLKNPIASMGFFAFIGFFLSVVLVMIVGHWLVRVMADKSGKLPTPRLPRDSDPYLLGYLRGGESEVIRLGALSLLQRGYLEQEGDGWRMAHHPPPAHHLEGVEAKLFVFVSQCAGTVSPDMLLEPASSLAQDIAMICEGYQRIAEEEQFLMPTWTTQMTLHLRRYGSWGLAILGGYKTILWFGHEGPLSHISMGVTILGVLLLRKVVKRKRLTKRGRVFFEQLELAHMPMYGREGNGPALVLRAAIFGLLSLEGSAMENYLEMYPTGKAAAFATGNCGVGCGVGSSCAGGGCGGGGGSCGGGCGGGCGGCGGCGG
jgi:uncharacterized protein (TIGR04222 family)